jgi:hypothetical protein
MELNNNFRFLKEIDQSLVRALNATNETGALFHFLPTTMAEGKKVTRDTITYKKKLLKGTDREPSLANKVKATQIWDPAVPSDM